MTLFKLNTYMILFEYIHNISLYIIYNYMIIFFYTIYIYIWLYNLCVCETKWLLAMFFSAVPSHCPHCRAGEVRVAGYTNEERLSCTALPWWVWCARFCLDRLMCFGYLWIILDILDHRFLKWFKPKRKNINIFRWLEKFWWCWTSLGLWFQDVGSILTYLLISRSMGRDGHPREPDRTCSRPHLTQPLAEWNELLC